MTGYSGAPLAKKLGIKEGQRIFIAGAPAGYRALLEPLPESVRFVSKSDRTTSIVHVFLTRRAGLDETLARLRRTLRADAAVWISWPKRSAGIESDLTEDGIRNAALPLGFVDVKVCAVDEIWSGLKLVVRKELRK